MRHFQELGKYLLQQARASDHSVATVEAKDVCGTQLVEVASFKTGCATDFPSQSTTENAGAETVHGVNETVLSFALQVLDGDDAH